jgi:hypothetical protein
VEYVIHNNGLSPLNALYAGVFTDWDIMDYSLNRADEDPAIKLGYNFSTQASGLYAGVKVLTGGPFIHYAIDNISGGAGGIDMFNGYSSADKYFTMANNRPQAGLSGNGNDVCDVVSTGPFSLGPGDSVVVAFALVAGDDLTDLVSSANNAQVKYDGITGIANQEPAGEIHSYPNPASDRWTVSFTLDRPASVSLRLFAADGRQVIASNRAFPAGRQRMEADVRGLSPGVYLYTLEAGNRVMHGKVIVTR